MSEHPQRAEQLRWLLEPPAKGDVRLVLELGENARLSPAAEQALDQLMKELYETEVQGYASQGSVSSLMLGATPRLSAARSCTLSCNQLTCNGFGAGKRS